MKRFCLLIIKNSFHNSIISKRQSKILYFLVKKGKFIIKTMIYCWFTCFFTLSHRKKIKFEKKKFLQFLGSGSGQVVVKRWSIWGVPSGISKIRQGDAICIYPRCQPLPQVKKFVQGCRL